MPGALPGIPQAARVSRGDPSARVTGRAQCTAQCQGQGRGKHITVSTAQQP